MRRIGCLLLGFFILLASAPVWAAPSVAGRSAVLINLKNGQVLYEKYKDKKLYPASTTKILTAIIAIESGKLDDIVNIGPNPAELQGTRVYLKEGEKVKLRDLVMAALIHSANDAALAIGEYLAGSSSKFAKIMNAKAKEIGAVNSNFVNPHGLSDKNHYTTAYDLALIGRYAMRNKIFRGMVNTKVLDWKGQEWQTRLININKMLWNYNGANGIKTGYTKEAGATIVASANRNNQELITVILGGNGNDIWKDAKNLLDYGYQNFLEMELTNPSKIIATVSVDKKKEVALVPKESIIYSLPQKGNKKIESKLSLLPLVPPIAKGQVVGHMTFFINGKELTRVDIVAKDSLSLGINYFNIALYVAAGLFILQLAVRTFLFFRRRTKMKRYSYSSYSRNYR